MARSAFVFVLIAALFLSYTMAQSPASSPVATPPRKAKTHAVSPSAKSPAVSPSTNSPAASPNEPSAAAPANSPSSISAPPTEAQGPSSGAFLNRVTVTGSAAVVIFATSLLI